MTAETFAKAKQLEGRIYRLNLMIKNTESLPAYVNDPDIREAPEVTVAMKALLLPDLKAKLAQEQAAFAAL